MFLGVTETVSVKSEKCGEGQQDPWHQRLPLYNEYLPISPVWEMIRLGPSFFLSLIRSLKVKVTLPLGLQSVISLLKSQGRSCSSWSWWKESTQLCMPVSVGCQMAPSCPAHVNEHCRKHSLVDSVHKHKVIGSWPEKCALGDKLRKQNTCAFKGKRWFFCFVVLFGLF